MQVTKPIKLWKRTVLAVILAGAAGLTLKAVAQESYVATTNINVRKGPGENYGVVAKIAKGTKVQVVGREGEWLKVQSKHGNPPGYIHGSYARPIVSQAKQTAPDIKGSYSTLVETEVRKGPGSNYAVVAKIPRDTKVQVVGAEGDWLKVQSKHGNPPGYIEKRDAQRLK